MENGPKGSQFFASWESWDSFANLFVQGLNRQNSPNGKVNFAYFAYSIPF